MLPIRTLIATVFFVLSVVVVIVSFASDMWLLTDSYRTSVGLWKICRVGNCRWFYEEDFLDEASQLPGKMKKSLIDFRTSELHAGTETHCYGSG